MRLMIYWRTNLISGSRQPVGPHTRQLLLWFSMGSWVRAIPYQNSHYFSSVAHSSMKTDLLFCWQKTTVLQPALCMPPVKRFRLLMSSFEIATHWENLSTLLNNWKCSFKTILHERLLLHAWADFKLLAIFCIEQEIGIETSRVLKAGVIHSL